jgi:GNAT superfamily N-acetyltransferase
MTAAKTTIHRLEERDFEPVRKLLGFFGVGGPTTDEMDNRLRFISAHPDQSLWVARAGEETIGFLGFRIRHNVEAPSQYGEVSTIVVEERWRKKGVGQLLLKHAEALARSQGCAGLWLVSGFGREAEAHRFYENMGFTTTGFRFVKSF